MTKQILQYEEFKKRYFDRDNSQLMQDLDKMHGPDAVISANDYIDMIIHQEYDEYVERNSKDYD